MTKTCKLTRTVADSGKFDFGIRDEKNRAVGYSWGIQSVVATLSTEPFGYILSDDHPMYFFEIRFGATRDGKTYGASNGRIIANTLEEARQLTVKKVEAAGKAYAKKYRKEVAA